jgi:hypothetical protein
MLAFLGSKLVLELLLGQEPAFLERKMSPV